MENQKDERLWRMAKRRASFKKMLFAYIVIVAFLWAIWWLNTGRETGFTGTPWPLWAMLGWGIALGFQYFNAYNGSARDLAEEEYERLKKQ
ncbi:MAG: 2TM domain-containing protein [Bacteroidota bacterium]